MERGNVLITVFAVCVLAGSALGWGSLISSFNCPSGSQYPNGVAYRSNNVYISTNTPDMCWRTTTTGSISRSHTAPGTYSRGIAAGVIGGTGYYWYVNNNPRRIYQVGYNSGSIYTSFTAPGSDPYGATYRWSGSIYYIYHTDSSGRRLYRMNATTGSIYGSYSLSFTPNDLAYDDSGYLWIADGSASVIRKCSMSGSVYDSFSVASYGYPSGVGFDGTYVWVGINSPLHRILRFEVTSGSAVVPTSLGKIKTVFR